jgi:type IX secretion system PorP/SprF family membrane protein
MRNTKLKGLAGSIFTLVASFFSIDAAAQVNPMLGIYYQNRYLANPAYAGINQKLNVNLIYKRELTKVEGTPAANSVSVDYGFGKVGVGLNVNTDRDGLLDINRYVVSYAYHLPVGADGALSLGLSGGITTEKINTGNLIGDEGDGEVGFYNDEPAHLDADFGVAYTIKNMTLQTVLPNLRNLFYENEEVRIYTPATFYAAASYRFAGAAAVLEPMVAYRGVKNYDGVVDAGVNAAFFNEQFNLMGIYHSTNHLSIGLGFAIQKKYQLQLGYTLPFAGAIRQYSDGNVQIGIKMQFLGK